MDKISVVKRSANMRAVRSKNTRPEMIVRRLVYHLGYRYRLHMKGIPGKPDLVFLGRKKIIFIHGCFWHGHEACRDGHLPRSNLDYWLPKLERNQVRDSLNLIKLAELKWDVLIVWECETKNTLELTSRLENFLSSP